MNLRKNNLINRFSDILEESRGRVQDAAGDLSDRLRRDGKKLAKQARRGYVDGKDRVLTAEENVVRKVRENPAVFGLIALVILGLVIGKLFLSSSRETTLMEEEW